MIQIQDYPNYLVTDDGRIYSSRTGIILKGGEDKDGYILVTLADGKRRRTAKVHREVAKAHLPNPNNFPCVNHIDGDKQNNHPSNLEWCTISYNTKHAYTLGALCQKGENNNASKYTDFQVSVIRDLYSEGVFSISEISAMTDVKYGTVYSYLKGLRR